MDKVAWYEIEVPSNKKNTDVMSNKIDKDLIKLLNDLSVRYGHGGKRRLLEASIKIGLEHIDFNLKEV